MGERRDTVDIKNKGLESDNMPQHIAIIMDGNGRWAKKRLLPRTMGHREGMKSIKRIVEACMELKVQVLTVYAFSTENWRRPQNEVDYLMDLLIEFLKKELQEMHENGIRIKVLGDYTSLPRKCVQGIEEALQLTSGNQKMTFNLAINYGSRTEILQAVKKMGQEILDGGIDINDISEEVFSSYLYTSNIPDPDLLIRTAGELRLSNFLLWQIAYTELWITDVTWPEFTRDHLLEAIAEYQKRDRRFGGLSPQQ
ncbi:undecaprenyl pyrophosphate synthetase [hydrocarbon metagenome]|uniref:Undecaprenyl pyrophosphate synthetase n=1 Tax=hydrocarbon metagenome TaxID=938273 RepID=A0A0W8E572_9ZZZZ